LPGISLPLDDGADDGHLTDAAEVAQQIAQLYVCWWARWPAGRSTNACALDFNNVVEVNFGLTHTPDRAKANMRAYM
jgi:hypothetical protein